MASNKTSASAFDRNVMGSDRTQMLDRLWSAQNTHGYIRREDIKACSSALGISTIEVEGVVSFYHFFSRRPRGEFTIYLNKSIVSEFKGYGRIREAFETATGVDVIVDDTPEAVILSGFDPVSYIIAVEELARVAAETARRAGDLTRMSELQYGRIPELEKQLEDAEKGEQGEFQLLRYRVTEDEIAEVVSRWTGIPVSRMLEGEREKLLRMEEALHRRVAQLREAYFDKRDKPRGDYRQLQEKHAQLAERVEQARLDLQAYEHKTDQLDKQQAALRSYLADRALEKAQAKLRDARDRHARVQALAGQVEAGRQKLSLSEAEQKAARLAWETRSKLVEEQQQAQQMLSRAGELLAQRETEVEPAGKAVEELKAKLATDKEHKAVQEARLRRARDAEQLARLTAEQKVLDTALEQARAADAARRRCQAQRDAIRVTAESLDALRSAEHRRVLAEVRLRTAATRVEYRLQPGASVRLAGQPIHGEDSVLVTEASALEVDAIGTFTIHPGGEDLDRLQAQLQVHARTLQDQLGELGVADIGAAEGAFKARQGFENEAKEHEARLSGLAPHGLSALEERAASLDSQRQALLSRMGAGEQALGEPVALERELGELDDRIVALEAELAQRQRVFGERREAVVEAGAAARSAQSQAQAAQQASGMPSGSA